MGGARTRNWDPSAGRMCVSSAIIAIRMYQKQWEVLMVVEESHLHSVISSREELLFLYTQHQKE